MSKSKPKVGRTVELKVALRVTTRLSDKQVMKLVERLLEAEATSLKGVQVSIPPRSHAKVSWSSGDVLTRAEEKGLAMTTEEAEVFLQDNKRQIQDDMVERGWDSIDTLLDIWKAEKGDSDNGDRGTQS